jgi:hypothetical protein
VVAGLRAFPKTPDSLLGPVTGGVKMKKNGGLKMFILPV